MEETKQPISYSKAIIFFLSGIIAIVTSLVLGEEAGVYGFLTGYGYTAIVGGIGFFLYSLVRNYNIRKQKENFS